MIEDEVERREAHQDVHNLGDDVAIPTEHREDILLKKTNQKPIEASNHGQDKCYCVHIFVN